MQLPEYLSQFYSTGKQDWEGSSYMFKATQLWKIERQDSNPGLILEPRDYPVHHTAAQ